MHELSVAVGMRSGAQLRGNPDFAHHSQALENFADVIGLRGRRDCVEPRKRHGTLARIGNQKDIERVQLLRAKTGQERMSRLFPGARAPRNAGALDG